MKYLRRVLGNGLVVIEVPSSDAGSVVVDFFVKTGSRSEEEKENGISHFLEHFLFKGTKKYPTAMAITELVDGVGGEMNANTGKEHTQYYIKAKASDLEMIFEILTDMLQNPLLDPVELEKEKGVIVEEINMYKDVPMYQVENILENAMWPKQAMGRDIAGTKNTVTKFTREMFESYINRHYQTPNMILGVSGKYDKKKLDSLIKKYWEPIKKKSFHKWEKCFDDQNKPRVSLEFKETEQAHFVLAFKGFSHTDKRNDAAMVLSTILGGGMSSRLFDEIREKRGLAYYVRASSGHYLDTGSFQVNAGVQVGKVEEAVKVVLDLLGKIKNEIVDEKELNKAKEYLKGKATLALEDNQARLDWFLEQEAYQKKIVTPEEMFERIDKIKAKDVLKVAQDLFDVSRATLAIVGPYKDKKVFEKILK